MALQFRIFNAAGTGNFYAGGVVTPRIANKITVDTNSPYRGQGPKYVYRKYFLNITEFNEATDLPIISDVSVDNITETSATINWTVNETGNFTLAWGQEGTYELGDAVGGPSSGQRSVSIGGLEASNLYNYRITERDLDDNSRDYYNEFSTIDLTAPLFIAGPFANNITASSASIRWTTDELSTSKVYYRSGASYPEGETSLDSSLVLQHVVPVSSLSGNTQYFYKVQSIDSAGNTGESAETSFTTLDVSAPALVISNIQSGNIGDTSGRITWETTNFGNSVVRYSNVANDITGNGTNYQEAFGNSNTKFHTGDLNNLLPDTLYYFRPYTTDDYNQTASGNYNTLTTTNVLQAPVITWLSLRPYVTSGLVKFNTNETATGLVDYASAAYYTANSNTFSGTVTGTVGTGFSIGITGLVENTAYKYRVKAIDSDFLTSFDQVRDFTTLDVTAPTLTIVNTGSPSTTSLSFSWTTNEQASSTVRIGDGDLITPNYFITQNANSTQTFPYTHNATVSNLTASTTYVYELASKDPSNNTGFNSGLITTSTAGGGPDTTPPVLTDIVTTASFNSASVSFNTNEPAIASVIYGTTNNGPYPSTQTQTGFSTSHQITLNGLAASTNYFAKARAVDASINTGESAQISFTTSADNSSSSNIQDGANVALVEFFVPDYGPTTFGADDGSAEKYIPVKVCVPVKDNNDLIFKWETEYGNYVQREVIKRDGAGQAKIVECIFPVKTGNLGDIVNVKKTIYIKANSQAQVPSQIVSYTIPDTKCKAYFGDESEGANGNIATATLTEADVSTYAPDGPGVILRGNFENEPTPYCRTVRVYKRMTVTTANDYHPSIKGMGVHFYVTQWSKNFFPAFSPQVDIRISNAWLNESAFYDGTSSNVPRYVNTGDVGIANSYYHAGAPGLNAGYPPIGQYSRGAIYYRYITLDTISQSSEGNLYSIVPDIVEYSMRPDSSNGGTFTLVKKMVNMSPPTETTDNSPFYYGGDVANYNAYFSNADCDHVMLAGSALTFRLAYYNRIGSQNLITDRKSRATSLAGCNYNGFVVKDTATSNKAVRSWSNIRSFTPSNIYCPTIVAQAGLNDEITRDVLDSRYSISYFKIKEILESGKWGFDSLLGAPNTAYPALFGPYRPRGESSGLPPGGFDITPFAGFNQSKYNALWFIQNHKLRSARQHQRVYSTIGVDANGNVAFEGLHEFGTPSSFEFFVNQDKLWRTFNSLDSTPNRTFINGPGGDIIGLVPGTRYIQDSYPFPRKVYVGSNDRRAAPWNKPKLAVTSTPNKDAGCWYYEDRCAYSVDSTNSYWNNPQAGSIHTPYDDYKLDYNFAPYSDSHQILYLSTLIGASEMLNDVLIKDDLLQIAELDLFTYCPHPTDDIYSASKLNLVDKYYGMNRGLANQSTQGVWTADGTGKHKGESGGRAFAWIQWAIAAAYQLCLRKQGTGRNNGTADKWKNGANDVIPYPQFRDYSMKFFRMTTDLFNDGYFKENGALHFARHPGVSIDQHPGLSHNGIKCYLLPQATSLGTYSLNSITPGVIGNGVYGSINSNNTLNIAGDTSENAELSIPVSNGQSNFIQVCQFDDIFFNLNDYRSPYYWGLSIDGDAGSNWNDQTVMKYRTFIVDPWINPTETNESWPAWEFKIRARNSTGSPGQLKLELYLVSPGNIEVKISDGATEICPNTLSSSYQNFKWRIRQKSPVTLNLDENIRPHYYSLLGPTLTNNTNHFQPTPYTLRAKLFIQISNDTIIIDNTNNSNYHTALNVPLRNRNQDIYDSTQIFEQALLSNAYYAIESQIVKPYAISTNDTVLSGKATTCLTQIAKFWNDLYAVQPTDFTSPNPVNHSAPWGKFGNGYVEAWMAALATNDYYPVPPGQTGLRLESKAGRYTLRQSADPFNDAEGDDYNGVTYTPGFSSIIGALALMELGKPWSNNPQNNTTGVPSFMLDKWCKMGQEFTNPIDHCQWVYGTYGFDPMDHVQNNALACGMVQYYQENPQQLTEGPAVNNVKLYIRNQSAPGRIEIASTPYLNDTISGASIVNSIGNVQFIENVVTLPTPNFRSPKGRNNAITLYNDQGILGGPVKIGEDINYSVPFWVKYRIDENNSQASGYIDIGIIAGDGPIGSAITTVQLEQGIPSSAYYNDPDNDITTTLGAERPGTNSITANGNLITFSFVGDETINYQMNFSAGSGNANGLIRVYESGSQSWPVYNGGLSYKKSDGSTLNQQSASITGNCTINTSGINGNTFTVLYDDNIDGDARSKTYTFTITGKSLRIKLEGGLETSQFSGNWTSASIGTASGCTNAKAVEVYGNGTVPTAIFEGAGSVDYYWSALPDLTQSNCLFATPSDPSTKTFSNGIINHHYVQRYNHDELGNILMPVDETFIVTVSTKFKDTIVKSTAPLSPYLSQLKDYYTVILSPGSEDQKNWTSANNSFNELTYLCQSWGMENVHFHPYFEWTSLLAPPELGDLQNQGPRWYPATAEDEFIEYTRNIQNTNNKIGAYTIWGYIFSGWYYWNDENGIPFPEVLCSRNYTSNAAYGVKDGYKISNLVTWSGLSGYITDLSYEKEIAWKEVGEFKRRYSFNFIYNDTIGVGLYWHPDGIDESSTSSVKCIKHSIAERKRMLDVQRYKLNGPMLSEGSNLDYTTDQCWLWHGYIDSLQRAICVNTGLSSFADIPADAYRSPQNYSIIPEYELWQFKDVQRNCGLGLSDRFHNAAGEDVQNPRTTFDWNGGQLFPYTTGMIRREHAYCVTYFRNPFRISYSSSNKNNEAPHQIMLLDYYHCLPTIEYLRNTNITGILYYTGNQWLDFDTQYKITKDVKSFTGVAIQYLSDDGTVTYVNHSRSATPYTFNINTELFVTLHRDDFIVYNENDNFISFNAAVSGEFGEITGNTNTNRISYLYRKAGDGLGKLEVFHGYGACSGFGNINTTGDNQFQFKALNYDKNKTIYTFTGITPDSVRYPEVATYNFIDD